MTTTIPYEAPAAQQAAVAAVAQQMIASWAHHDADGFANLFTEDGTMILPGVFRQGRDDIRAYFKDAFDHTYKGTQVTGKPISLRFFGPDVALLLSYGGVIAASESEVSEAQAVRASWFVVRVDGKWLLAAYQNSPAKRSLPAPGTDA
ncbi:SgcJ/EcaC family oxidoreductase [Streptosporangium sp. NBC_01639]|uniref:SgcJ/EcaC family oxidoreductase n=1 Tax=unclassified Streptosporangium TaxID=2632669 RepID=UPI002DD87DCE|nr:SgcJ/EcaC family oxidoreductase [Streptosporangium sp. NBC_01756]WSC85372.1 SgcJ/EcaC family oxidoreductase [Streptosporangium sp. NBC_01756]WTD55992.1 SgcJ/EcaC family oxidoreductase [Streptosporangium sp. NBC_01639]